MACLQQALKTNLEQIGSLVLRSAAMGTFTSNQPWMPRQAPHTLQGCGRSFLLLSSLSLSPPTPIPLIPSGNCVPSRTYFCPLPESNRIHHSCSLEGEVSWVQTAASAPHQEKCRGIYRATHGQGRDSAIPLSQRPSLPSSFRPRPNPSSESPGP